MQIQKIQHFSPIIRSLSTNELGGAPTLFDKLRITGDNSLAVCYAPFEYINTKAQVVIVGITPGQTQMLNALKECRRQLDAGASDADALRAAKLTGAFSGAMRPNLVGMLDAIGLHRLLGISTCDDLFGKSSHLAQTTSVLRNPVFLTGSKNYNGTPKMTTHALLKQQIIDGFGQDVKALPNAIYLPLGDKVAAGLKMLVDLGHMDKRKIIEGLPHPSPANAERIAYFLGKKAKADLSIKTNADKIDSQKAAILAKMKTLH
jgi:hypothetical protein